MMLIPELLIHFLFKKLGLLIKVQQKLNSSTQSAYLCFLLIILSVKVSR